MRRSQPFKKVGEPPAGLSAAGAFRELCCTSLPYLTGGEGPAPYEAGRVSLPEGGSPIVYPEEQLPPEHRDLLIHGRDRMLRNSSDVEQALLQAGVTEPHHDPAFRSPKTYGIFLIDLQQRGLLEWQIGGRSFLGIFRLQKIGIPTYGT